MIALKDCLRAEGFSSVSTYIASGNVILRSDKSAAEVKSQVEKILPARFKLDSELIKVLVLTYAQLRAVVHNKPKGFGAHPDEYHSDAIFLIDIDAAHAMAVFSPKEGIDTIWPGRDVIYSQRLSALRTKSRLSKIMGTPAYKSMTIRTWNTTTKLQELLETMMENH
jgi:uncharacterized protein (DUF1697 family)